MWFLSDKIYICRGGTIYEMPYNNIISRGDTAEGAAMAAKDKADAGQAEVQDKMNEITDKGFRGDKVDPTPNEAYTVAGVTSGAHVPEDDVVAEGQDDSGKATDTNKE